VPSFEALVVRTERGGRALTEDEEKKLLAIYPPWMRRLAEFADETCLAQGDLLRVTEDAIDTKTGILWLNFGRGKTGLAITPHFFDLLRFFILCYIFHNFQKTAFFTAELINELINSRLISAQWPMI
jgi:hypothetical protein